MTDKKKMEPKKRHCVGDCNFAAYYDSQIGRGVRNIASYSGKPFQRGFGVDDIQIYHGRPYQRGHGIGTVFRRIGIPIVKFLGRHLLPASVAVGSDLMNNRSLKASLRERGANAFRSAGNEGVDKIASFITQSGGGRVYKKKRKRKISKKITKRKKTIKRRKITQRKKKSKKRVFRDIFNGLPPQ